MPKSKTSNILVAVRVRDGVVGPKTLKVMDEKLVVASDPMEAHKKNVLRTKRTREKQYAFDYAFGPEVKSTKVYESTTRHLIDGVLDGYNATVFAYGATGSGKTFTMLGTDTEPGIMVFTLRDLFSRCRNIENDPSSGVKYTISISYLEVYNELIRDLLTPSNEFLDLREDPTKGPTVAGLSEVSTNSTDEVMRLLQKGNKRRTQEATAANAESSRSHAVLQVSIERRESAPGVDKVQVQVGKLSMIDLAGSERASVTKNRGQRLVEGANINRSLLALGNCINALAKKGSKGSYIPYRDSKLTRLLKDSLGGSCRTVMITCVSPASRTFEETVNSLKYANRAKNIKTNVKRNVLNVKYHITEYKSLISGLKEEISKLRSELDVKKDENGVGNGNAGSTKESSVTAQAINRFDPVRQSEGSARFQRIRNNIVANFNERMQLRRSLMEVEATNVENHVEIDRRLKKVAMLEADLGYGSECDFSDLDEFDGLGGLESGDSPGLGLLDSSAATVNDGRSVMVEREIHGLDGEGERRAEEEEEEDEEEEEEEEEEEDNLQEDGDDEEDGFSDTEDINVTQASDISTMNIEDVEPTPVAIVEDDLTTETMTTPYESKCEGTSEHKEQLNDVRPAGTSSIGNNDHRFRKRPTKSRRRRRRKVRNRRQELIHRLTAQVEELKDAISTNEKLKYDINNRLEKNRKQADALRQELATRANSHERRTLMELEYRVLKVELEKLELERSAMLQELVVRQRDEVLHRARRQLRVRDLIIAAQQELLEAHGLTVGPHVESLFGRLETIENIFELGEDGTGLNAMVTQAADEAAESNGGGIGSQNWSLDKAVYPVSKIDDIVQVNLARSLQVPKRKHNNSSSHQHHQHSHKNKHQHKIKTLASVATEPENIGPRPKRRSSTRPKVSRSRSQVSVYNGRRRSRGHSSRSSHAHHPPTIREPTARELERAKRRSGSGNSGGSGNNGNNGRDLRRERMVVWEQKQQRDEDGDHHETNKTTSSSGGRQHRSKSHQSQHQRHGGSSNHSGNNGNNGGTSHSSASNNGGWAERLKMYLKTPRSRFSKKSGGGRSRSKSPTKNMGKDQKSSSLTRTPNQPPKLAGKTRSASAVPTDLSSVMTSSPESKHNVTVAPASGGGDQSFMSPPPKKTSRGSGTSVPKKLKIHVEIDSSQSPENFADENSQSERKMTPLPSLEKKQARRWSPPPSRRMFGDEAIKTKPYEVEEGRKALSRLNHKIKKKHRGKGPVVNYSKFFQKRASSKK